LISLTGRQRSRRHAAQGGRLLKASWINKECCINPSRTGDQLTTGDAFLIDQLIDELT
jgi:hypothetical protein